METPPAPAKDPVGDGESEACHSLLQASGDESTLNQTGFLLARLKELREWQKLQEDRLIREQEEQMEKLKRQQQDGGNGDESDDATIDQEFSSLASYEEPVPSGSGRVSLTSSEDLDDVGDARDFPPRFSNNDAVPSWAAASEDDDVPRTVFERASAAANEYDDDFDPDDDYDGENNGLADREDEQEKPIRGCQKTFEELLAERLAEEEASPQHSPVAGPDKQHASPAFVRSSKNIGFLRKGSGLKRYRGSGSPPKTFKRSQSQGNVVAAAATATSNGTPVTAKPKLQSSKSLTKLNSCSDANRSPQLKPAAKSNAAKAEKPLDLNRLAVPGRKGRKKPESSKAPQVSNGDNGDAMSPIYDSVEWSFREKLKKAEKKHKKELEDLAAFEMLEEAADDSSFCSSSSKVKNLIADTSMPSPIQKPKLSASTPKGTNTNGPTSNRRNSSTSHSVAFDEEQSIGHTLMNDIQQFLERKGATGVEVANGGGSSENDDDDEEEDDTLRDEDDIGAYMPRDDEPSHSSGNKKNVRFRNLREDFSPPRIPKSSPSYLIWSIFTKEREEKRKERERKKRDRSGGGADPSVQRRSRSPLSQLALEPADNFQNTLLNAKLVELEKEVAHFQKESQALAVARRKLQADRKSLANDVANFERRQEADKKKNEEEKRRIKRDRMLMEKAQKDRKCNDVKRATDELEDLQNKYSKLLEDSQRKETKLTATVSKLQEQVKFLERENQHLHEENHKMKIKGASSKISTSLTGKSSISDASVASRKQQLDESTGIASSPSASSKHSASSALDSGISRGQVGAANGGTSLLPNGHQVPSQLNTPRLTSFSPADSLESNMTLVSGVVNQENIVAAAAPAPNTDAVTVISSVEREGKNPSVEKTYSDGSVEILYSNGNRKTVSPDGSNVRVFYYNGDVKESIVPDGLVKYFYSQTKTWHITYPNKREVLQFENGQEEIRHPDGSLQISFPDGSVKKVSTDGSEDMSFPDGTRVEVKPNGDRTLRLLNGQREIHTADFKRREYPDGTVKTLFNDGRQETRYSNGRTRIKDKDGNLLHDSMPSAGPTASPATATAR